MQKPQPSPVPAFGIGESEGPMQYLQTELPVFCDRIGIPGMDVTRMKEQNQRALLALRRHTAPGGKVLVYYPEGGRGDGRMKDGEPRTSCIPRNISENGSGLIILPTYVSNTETLLPAVRGQNEYNEIFAHMNKGAASLTIGKPICWNAVCETNRHCAEQRHTWNQNVCNSLLGLVARLGPPDEAGRYGPENSELQALISPLLDKAIV